jgi:serine/threonine protein kinase
MIQVSVDDFDLIRVIGKGSFGKVTLVRKKSGGQLYAMKVSVIHNTLNLSNVVYFLCYSHHIRKGVIQAQYCKKKAGRAY